MPDEQAKQIVTTTDTKTIIFEQFGRAGPWALLAVLVLGGVGYELDYFLKRYVQQSDETMTILRKNTSTLSDAVTSNVVATEKLSEALKAAHDSITLNGTLLQNQIQQHALMVKLLEDAGDSMEPVAEERRQQTELLKAIKAAVEKNGQP